MVGRELRVAARKRSTFWLRITAAMVGLMIGAGCIALSVVNGKGTVGIGGVLFGILSWIAIFGTLAAGLFFTSDCLSEEKREGTLGLLFLTDLRGYDVVTGKLVVTSLRGCFALLAIFPILAITLLMGGVEVGHFWKTTLALLNSLFCSLAAGLFVSALSRDSQRALSATVFLLGVLVFGGPIADAILANLYKHRFTPVLSVSSPGYAFAIASSWGRSLYWTSLLITHGIGWILLIATSVLIPRTWQDKAKKDGSVAGNNLRLWRYGSAKRRQKLRAKLLDSDAILWLACRERWQAIGMWMWAIASSALFVWMVIKFEREAWVMWQYLAWFFLLFFYLWAASQACRFFVEARRSGLIELLLASPVSERDLIRGQWRALMRMFGLPVLMLVGIFAVGAGLSQASWQRITSSFPVTATVSGAATNSSSSGTNVSMTSTTMVVSVRLGNAAGNAATNSNSGTNVLIGPARTKLSPLYFGLILLGGTIGGVTTAANFIALFWFGMWMGMTSKSANTATAKTIIFVHVIPWLCITFAAGMTVSVLMMSMTFKSGSSPSARFMLWYPLLSAVVIGILTLAKDIGFFLWARKRLRGHFREQAFRSISVLGMATQQPAPVTVPPPPVIQSQNS